jgi:hypothetical protein
LAFAAALTATMGDDQVAGNVLVGSFGMELALILEASRRKRLASVAASDQLEGQAVAWALAEHPLIGEEMFVAGAYLGENAAQRGSVVALDTLRWVLIIGIVVATALLLQQPVVDAINRLIGGG